jgi:hypothetical protein
VVRGMHTRRATRKAPIAVTVMTSIPERDPTESLSHESAVLGVFLSDTWISVKSLDAAFSGSAKWADRKGGASAIDAGRRREMTRTRRLEPHPREPWERGTNNVDSTLSN